jgi:hypothetical protein
VWLLCCFGFIGLLFLDVFGFVVWWLVYVYRSKFDYFLLFLLFYVDFQIY